MSELPPSASLRRRELLYALAGSALAGVACDPRELARRSGSTRRLSIAAGLTGGVYYAYGGGIAKVVSESLPGVEATAEATAGSVDNLKLLHQQKADLAFTLADTLDEALRGHGPFRELGAVPARALAVLYGNSTHLVTLADSGIRAPADLAGRVVSLGAPGSGTETVAVRILEAVGIDPATGVQRQALGVGDSVDALKDGKLDAFFWSAGVPTGALLDLASTPGRRMRLVPNAAALPELQRRYGTLYFETTIAKDAYPDMEQAVPVVGVANVLVVHESLEEELGYALTRTLFERQPELIAIHPEARNLSLAGAVAGSPAPFHPGAERFYRERGAWRS